MSAMSQIMDATYCIGGDMDFGRMFDQYLHKGGDNFDLALSVPDASPHHHGYMTDQPTYGNFGSEEGGGGGGGGGYGEMPGLGTPLPGGGPQDSDAPPPPPPPPPPPQPHHPHHPQAMYQHQMSMANPQFPPQNLYIPPISQHNMGPVQTSGYLVPPQCGPPAPVYTNAMPPQGPPPQHMMGAMMGYYPRHPTHLVRTGGSPNSGGSPSPGSEDSDDSTPLAQQMARAKRPSESVEGTGARGKKPKVSKKSKKKKDPNEPQKPVSAYALFFRDTQAAIKGTSPNASFGEVSKIVASMWDSLDADHKNVYKKKTEAAKKEYLKALAAYRASLVSKQAPGSLTSPGGAASPGGGPQPQQQHSPQQQPQQVATQQQAGQQQQQQTGQTQQQQQQPQQQAQQQGGGQPQQAGGAPPQQGAQQGQQPPQQGSGGGGQQGAMGQQHLGCPSSGPNCIRSGCTNPAVHNPEWEDEYCSNECVVSHCRDVFSNWVASNHHQPINPTYPAPVK